MTLEDDFQTYEISMYINGRWRLQARYEGQHRDDAMDEAKELEKYNPGAVVKVVRDRYNSLSGLHEEVVLYRTRGLRTGGNLADGMSIASRSRGGFGISDAYDDSMDDDGPNPWVKKRRVIRKTEVGAWTFFVVMTSIVFLSLAISAVFTGFISQLVRGFQVSISGQSMTNILLGAFTLCMFVVGGSATKFYLNRVKLVFRKKRKKVKFEKPSQALEEYQKEHPNGESDADFKPKRSIFDRILNRDDDYDPNFFNTEEDDDEPQEAKPLPAEVTEIAEEDLLDMTVRDDDDTEATDEDQGESTGYTLDEGSKRAKSDLLAFLSNAIDVAKQGKSELDLLNRFGVNLFFTGATKEIVQHKGLDEDTEIILIRDIVELLGAKPEQAAKFAMTFDDYLKDPRHHALFERGQILMGRYLNGDRSAPGEIVQALKDWNNWTAPTEEQDNDPTVVVFTDIVNSTDINTQHGDFAALEMVNAHNLIVRTALTNFDGREVKHLGDGIMATFKSVTKAVNASIEIQNRIAGHNRTAPEVPLHLRIGINAGAVIEESGDLFGSTVQMAARLCNSCGPNVILVSDSVVTHCKDQTVIFVEAGDRELKGFDQPVHTTRVVWDKRREVVAEAAENPGQVAETGSDQPVVTVASTPSSDQQNLSQPLQQGETDKPDTHS